MKVVFLADAPYVHTQRWVQHFVQRGVDCDVISFRPAEIEGARVHHVAGAEPLGKARYLIHARRVGRLIQALQPDLVHALHLTSYGFLGALSGFRPLVISVWGTDILEAPRLTPFHLWLTRYALARADAITATGLHLATETSRYAPRGKPVTSVPYGVDLNRFSPSSSDSVPPSPLTERGPGSEVSVVIGAASRISQEKGLPYLVEAFAALRARYGDRVRLRIAGDTTPEPGGAARASLEALAARLGVSDAIDFTGWLDHDALPEFLRGLDIFVLPSIYEGFGVAAVEASATGLPVVASRAYGIPDVVRDGHTGVLVPPKDAALLAAAIAGLIDDPALRSSIGSAGRAYVAEHYDWNENARQMELLHQHAIERRAGQLQAAS
jgi:glycosyltransferase involved in cell wall biosynthesis